MALIAAKPTIVRGKKMWVVDIPARLRGKRKRIFRDAAKDAENVGDAMLGEVQQFGQEMAKVSMSERAFILRWRGKLTLDEMDKLCERAHETGLVTCAQAVERYLDAPREEPLSDVHLRPLKSRLGKFSERFEKRPIAEVTTGQLEDFIRGQGGSAVQYYANLRSLFGYARRQEWVRRDLFELIERPEMRSAEKTVLTPAQMRACLRIAAGVDPGSVLKSDPRGDGGSKAARHDPLLRYLVLGGFCGLRTSEALRLRCEDIDLSAGPEKRGEIHVRRMKTARGGIPERWVSPEPVAAAWLKWMELPKSGPVVAIAEKAFREARKRLVAAAKLGAWPDNGLRRSFGSYALASLENAALVAEMMGHVDASTTKGKYKVPRRKEIALEWFALTPESVLDLP